MSAGRVGIALEAGRLVLVQAAEGEGAAVVRWTEVACEGNAPPSAEALSSALESAGIDARRATLALGGDVAVAKPVALPPVPTEIRVAILRQDGERFFILPPAPRCYGVWEGVEDEDAWVVAASEDQVLSLMAAIEELGIAVEAVTLAPALYRDAVGFLLPRAAARPAAVLRSVDGVHEVVTLRSGRLLAYRRWDGEPDGWREALAGGGGTDGPIAVLVETGGPQGPASAGVEGAQRSPAGEPSVVVPSRSGVDRPARLLAALGAALLAPGRSDVPDLMPPAIREGRRRVSVRRTAILAVTTALLLVLFLALLGIRRDRRDAHLAEELAAVQAAAGPVIEMRTDLQRISREIVAHQRVVRERTDWLEVLQELSLTLPTDAWLASFESRETGDMVVTGYARSAGDVVAALAASPKLGDVKFESQATRTQVGGRSVESFSLAVEWIDAPE